MPNKKQKKKAAKTKSRNDANKEQKLLFYLQLALVIIQLLEEILPHILHCR